MKKGFSLVELIIYIAIIGVVMGSYVSFMLNVSSVRSKTFVVHEVSENARLVLETIKYDIKVADDIVAPTEGNSASSLELNMPNTADNTVYSLTGNIVNQTIGVNPSTPLTSSKVKVTSLVFENLTKQGKKENIRITLTLEYANAGAVEFTYVKTFTTSVSVRK